MKKPTLILLTIFVLTLTACGDASRSTQAGPASGSQSGPNAGALPAATQLIIGTIKLDGTAQAVTTEQAAELLPLWQTMVVLTNSDTAANQEKEALITQIQETMTAEQTQAIKDMNLTREDMSSIMQQQGMTMGGAPDTQSSNSQNGNSSRNSSRNFGPSGGGFPGGGMPPDGGGPGGGGGFGGQGQNMSEDQIATAQAARQANENFVPPMLINAVIDYLQKKAGS
jgi:hypothetical protein